MESIVVVVVLMGTLRNGALAAPQCRSAFDWLREESDCSVFYRCSWSRLYRFDCPAGLVFSKTIKNCVRPGNPYDDCDLGDTIARPITLEEQCQRGARLVAHAEECQLYYNCSKQYDVVPRFFEQRLMECKYPLVFDRDRQMCRDFSLVDCDKRKVHKSACNYRHHMCPRAHCIPCTQTFPSCERMADGPNIFISREWSPYYVICRAERTVERRQCPPDNNFQVPQFFHPEKNTCVNIYTIPRERGGAMPSCERRFNGAHPLENGRRGTAYICQGGQLLSVRYCPPGARPEPEPRNCVYS